MKFESLQYALFVTTFVSVLGGLFFLFAAFYIVKDKDRATKLTRGSYTLLVMSVAYVPLYVVCIRRRMSIFVMPLLSLAPLSGCDERTVAHLWAVYNVVETS